MRCPFDLVKKDFWEGSSELTVAFLPRAVSHFLPRTSRLFHPGGGSSADVLHSTQPSARFASLLFGVRMLRAPSGSFDSSFVRGPIPLLVVLGMMLCGCTVTSFLGSQYTNFTAYYNKFYNAEKAFEKGLKRISSDDPSVDRARYLSIFRKPEEDATSSSFDKAIQKSADVLRDNPDSKWVDDALLLIGKSYFYQQNFVGASQKFREILSLNAERAEEARFWLARTLLEVDRYEEAAEVIRVGVQEGEASPWTARLYLVRGELHSKQGRWEEAAQALNRGLEGDLPDRPAARAAFLLGQALETLGNPEPARAAYREVQEYGPSYSLEFAARLSEIELQGQYENASRALERLEELEGDEKNYDQRGEMAVVRARIYRAQGKLDRARQALTDMLYREDAPKAAEGRLHYDLARLYRDEYEDFSKAAAHFDTASTSLTRGRTERNGGARRLPGAPGDVGSEADRYRDLAERAQEVARMDSLLRVGRLSDREFQRFVEDLRRQRQAEQEAQAAKQDEKQSRRLRRGQQAVEEQRRETASAANTGQSDAGFLFHNNPSRVQEGKRQFEQTWGDRPLVDNWRRQSAIRNVSTASTREEETGAPEEPSSPAAEEGRTGATSNKESTFDLSAIPRDSASQAKMEAERAVTRYELANSLFLAAGRPDSAATWYRRILQENGDHPVAPRALYALAESYRAQGDTTAAQQTYRRLVDRHPDTDLARRARQRLGRRQRATNNSPAVLADSAYAQAYDRWQNGQAERAFPDLLGVADQYPDTEAAPRALLVAGLVYWKEVQRDSKTDARQVLKRHLRTLRPTTAIGSDSAPFPPDSAEAVPDVGVSDSSGTAPREKRSPSPESVLDSSRGDEAIPGDSLRTATVNRPEGPERPVRQDSMRPPADTVETSGRAAPDSARQVAADRTDPDPYAPLDSLLTYLTDRYPDAPQVGRARTMLDLIEERRSGGEASSADTTTQEPPTSDTTGAAPDAITQRRLPEEQDSSAQARGRVAPDTSRSARANQSGDGEGEADGDDRDLLPAPTGVSDREDEDESGQEGIDRAQGGWALLVNSFSTSQKASTRVAVVGEQLSGRWPVDLLKEAQDDDAQYRLVVGQFESQEAAEQAKETVANQLSSEPTVWKIP